MVGIRTNIVFNAIETVYQMESKKLARKDPVFKTKEIESKQSARTNLVFKFALDKNNSVYIKNVCVFIIYPPVGHFGLLESIIPYVLEPIELRSMDHMVQFRVLNP